jgi:hypothetical protein
MKAQSVYDNYEISGCCRHDDHEGRTFIETCDDDEAHFWTLYGHIDGQGVEAIGNFTSRAAAEQVYYRITGQPFTASYEASPRLRLMHAAPNLLAALQTAFNYMADDLDEGDATEMRVFGVIRAAIAGATDACPRSEPAADTPAGDLRSYSVLLLYPDYQNDSGTETYYAYVKACDQIEAVSQAQQQAAVAQEGVEIEPDDFAPLLVTQGHHSSEALFNK